MPYKNVFKIFSLYKRENLYLIRIYLQYKQVERFSVSQMYPKMAKVPLPFANGMDLPRRTICSQNNALTNPITIINEH